MSLLFQCLFLLSLTSTVVSNLEDQEGCCPFWHIPRNGRCECGAGLNGVVSCDESFVFIKNGYCVTWSNSTNSAELYQCPLAHLDFKDTCSGSHFNAYHIRINISGRELNYLTCKSFNRLGTHCRQCIDGYGPAAFSNRFSCADCSKHKHFWVLSLLFQLTMSTLLCLAFIPLQVKGTSSPLNIIITYAQLGSIEFKLSGNLQNEIVCYIGQTFTNIIITILGFSNLDFFYVTFPPLCISSSFKAINSLLFEYVIAIYPMFFTVFIYMCIELHDRNWRLVVFLCLPIRRCFGKFHTWDPKKTILNTFATFFLLSYSKFLFTSISLFLVTQSYNSTGATIPDSAVLLYDPSVRFFHSEHIPYVAIAMFILLIFVILPPLLLLFYPTRLFRKGLTLFGFRRWDILHNIMDIFQGWYKDGTEGTRDYRSFSALYLLLRIGLSCEFAVSILRDYKDSHQSRESVVVGIFHILLGVLFFAVKPYKKTWMNHVDGIVFAVVGYANLVVCTMEDKPVYISTAAIGVLVMTFLVAYAVISKYRGSCKPYTNQ